MLDDGLRERIELLESLPMDRRPKSQSGEDPLQQAKDSAERQWNSYLHYIGNIKKDAESGMHCLAAP